MMRGTSGDVATRVFASAARASGCASIALALACGGCTDERIGGAVHGDDAATDFDAAHEDGGAPHDSGAADRQDAHGEGSPVAGTVVDFATGRPLMGRTVRIGDESATTDAAGSFRFEQVAAPFDAVVLDADGKSVSVYVGVSQRELLLPHTMSAQPANFADISGTISGGGAYPLAPDQALILRFLSEAGEGELLLAPEFGPDYGPLRVAWDGDEAITGTLLALRFSADAEGEIDFSGYAAQQVTLHSGQPSAENLTLMPVGKGRVSGTIAAPAEQAVSYRQRLYRVPFSFAAIPLSISESSAVTFDDSLPELPGLGGSYCIGAGSSEPFLLTERCGFDLGAKDVSITVQPPPSLSEPAEGATLDHGTLFTWSAFENGVHRLALISPDPSASAPSVYVFTAGTSAKWPDSNSIGIGLPVDMSYDCSVAGLGPYPGIDEALSRSGIAARTPLEARRSYSASKTLVTRAASRF